MRYSTPFLLLIATVLLAGCSAQPTIAGSAANTPSPWSIAIAMVLAALLAFGMLAGWWVAMEDKSKLNRRFTYPDGMRPRPKSDLRS